MLAAYVCSQWSKEVLVKLSKTGSDEHLLPGRKEGRRRRKDSERGTEAEIRGKGFRERKTKKKTSNETRRHPELERISEGHGG